MDIKDLDKEYIAPTYARFPLTLVEGNGSLVYDDAGKEYIDMSTGIAVNTFGYSDARWAGAVSAQLTKIQHTSNLYYSEPCARLAEQLCTRTGMKKVFFSNSGAEANECAIKVARKYAADKKGADCHVIVSLKNSFHGRTLTTLAATGQDSFHTDFTPLTPGFAYAEANNIDSVKQVFAENKVAGIIMELVQGEGGVCPLTAEFVQGVATLAKEQDIVLIIDEVQTGNGRCGALYAYMNFGIEPDVVSTAKGLAGGLPLGATMLGEKVQNVLTPGLHGSTFGGNPVSCAGALNILSRIDEKLLCDVRRKSEYLFAELNNMDGVHDVTGMGLMIGFATNVPAAEYIARCMDAGLLVIKAKNKIRLLPALNIPDFMLERAVSIMREAAKI